jgi:hypothetical protein
MRIKKFRDWCPSEMIHHGSNYLSGYVVTPDGVVGFYADTAADYTMMFVSRGGYYATVRRNRFFTYRGLITVCRRFAAEATPLLEKTRSEIVRRDERR